MADETVYVLTIEHKHGSNVTTHTSRETALAAAAAYARQWWERELIGGDPPESDLEVIATYFEVMEGREFYSIEEASLPRKSWIVIERNYEDGCAIEHVRSIGPFEDEAGARAWIARQPWKHRDLIFQADELQIPEVAA